MLLGCLQMLLAHHLLTICSNLALNLLNNICYLQPLAEKLGSAQLKLATQ